MDGLATAWGLLSGSSPEKAKDVGYRKIGKGLASGANRVARDVSAMTGQSIGPILTYEGDAKNTWQAIERNVLPRYGASTVDPLLASRRFYANPVLAKHVEDASRSYSKSGLDFAQVLDGVRPNKGLGTHWMQLQHQSQGRGYVDEQVGRLHNALQAYMQDPATRPQLNAAVAQFKSNIEGRRLIDVLTPAQIEAWKSAQYELKPATRVEAKFVGVTLKTRDGQSLKLIGEVHLTTKVELNGQTTLAGASLERVSYDTGPDLVGSKGHKNLGANRIDVGVSNGLHGKPVGVRLRTWKDIELATRDALQGRAPLVMAADARARLKAMSQTSISQGLPKILQQVLPDGGGSVRPLLQALEGVGTGGNKFALDAVRGTVDTALTALSGFGELVNVAGQRQQLATAHRQRRRPVVRHEGCQRCARRRAARGLPASRDRLPGRHRVEGRCAQALPAARRCAAQPRPRFTHSRQRRGHTALRDRRTRQRAGAGHAVQAVGRTARPRRAHHAVGAGAGVRRHALSGGP
jgi:hypothetical protein